MDKLYLNMTIYCQNIRIYKNMIEENLKKTTDKYKDYNIDYNELFDHPDLTIDILVNHYIVNCEYCWNWDWDKLYMNPNISKHKLLSYFENTMISASNNKDNDDDYYDSVLFATLHLSQHVNINDVLKYTNMEWSFDVLSSSQYITMNDIENHPELPWNYLCLSSNPNLTIDMVIDNRNIDKLDWSYVSFNPNIKMEHIIQYPDLPWDFCYLSRNPNITIDFICQNLNKPWNSYFLHKNKFLYDPIRYNKIISENIKKSFFIISDLSKIINEYV